VFLSFQQREDGASEKWLGTQIPSLGTEEEGVPVGMLMPFTEGLVKQKQTSQLGNYFYFLVALNKQRLNYSSSNHSFQMQSSLLLKQCQGYHGLLSVQGQFLAALSSTSATQWNLPGWLANFKLYKYTTTDNSKSKSLSPFKYTQ